MSQLEQELTQNQSKHAVELCALLVDETYGELTSRIFTILLRRGRLTIPLLSKHTRLSPHKIRHGLAVLIQENLVYHYFDEDTNTTHYEANPEAAYMLVRSGKIVEIARSRYGDLAAEIMGNLFLSGHSTVKELVSWYVAKLAEAEAKRKREERLANGLNGQSKAPTLVQAPAHPFPTGQMHGMLTELLESGLIHPLFGDMFLSPTDTYDKIAKETLKEEYGGNIKGTKQKEELKEKIRERLYALRSERAWKSKGKKRALNGNHANGVNGASKRRRLSNGAVNGDHYFEDDGTKLDPNMLVRINYEKCTVVLRNSRLAGLASSRIGSTTAQVYEAGLRLIEKSISRCRLDPRIDDIKDLPDGSTFTTMELTATLSKSVKTGAGIGTVSSDKIDTRKLEKARKSTKRSDEAEAEGEASEDEDVLMEDIPIANGNGNISDLDPDSDSHGDDPFDDENTRTKSSRRAKVTFQDQLPKPEAAENRENRMLQVKNHLLLLAGDDCHFLRKCGSRGLGEWTVDFEGMTQYLQEVEMDTMLLENFGKVGHRLARMMRKLGKLDEKQLPNLALVKQKDARTKLAEMQMAGVVDIQEVPRDSGRTTSRTIFLWYFDVERVSTILLDSIYKNMSRCFQRLDIERRRVQDVLALTERTDLLDEQPEKYMDQEQLNTLHEIEDKEESILGHIGRLDELVAIFRDY